LLGPNIPKKRLGKELPNRYTMVQRSHILEVISRRGLFSMQTLFLIVSNVQVRRGLAKKVVPQFLELFKF
jgi:hypothetical protein